MTPRSLVGMTMGARRRRLRRESAILRANLPYLDDINVKLMFDPTVAFRRLRPLVDLQESYQLGQRLRPCPGCDKCTNSPRLQVIGWVRRIGGRAKLTRLFSRWYQRAEYLLMIYRRGPTWNPAAGGGVTKAEAWANMCNCLRDHDELNVVCDGSGVLPARAKKVRR